MTEMVYGSRPARAVEPVLPRWWRTIDKWSLSGVMVRIAMNCFKSWIAEMATIEDSSFSFKAVKSMVPIHSGRSE